MVPAPTPDVVICEVPEGEGAPCGVVTCGVPEGDVAPCVTPVGLVAPPPPTPIVGGTDVVATLAASVGLGCEQGTTQSVGFDPPPAPGPPEIPV